MRQLSRGTSQMDPASVSASLFPAARTTVKTASTPRRGTLTMASRSPKPSWSTFWSCSAPTTSAASPTSAANRSTRTISQAFLRSRRRSAPPTPKIHLVVHRLRLRPKSAAAAGVTDALLAGLDVLVDRAVHRRPQKSRPALPRLRQPAPHRPAQNPENRCRRPLGRDAVRRPPCRKSKSTTSLPTRRA